MALREIPFPEDDVLRLMDEKQVPGMSIAIIENGETIFNHAYGVKNYETSEPVDNQTVFEAASLSKPVFAYGVLQLVDEGTFNLDTPLVEYLPHPNHDIENIHWINSITGRMVLCHTTGFPNWKPLGKKLKIHFKPGEKFSYSGEGYVYLQKVIEHLTGLTLEQFIKERVFIPFGMTSSSYVWQPEYEKIKAVGHSIDGDTIDSLTPQLSNAAYTLHTTALDYAKFILEFMNNPRQMLAMQVKAEEGCIHCIEKPRGKLSDAISWGLGWGLQNINDEEFFWHWGDNIVTGFKCFVVGSISKKSAVIVFTNSNNGLSVILELLYKIYGFRMPAFDWLDTERVPF